MKLVLAIHLLSTIGMFGVIWIVQLVHYPLFDRVDTARYIEFQQAHEARISLVVVPLMLGELATSVLLAAHYRAAPHAIVWYLGLGCVLAAWASTFLLSVPEHQALARGFDAAAHARLVSTNWIRTACWTAHALIAIYGTFQVAAATYSIESNTL